MKTESSLERSHYLLKSNHGLRQILDVQSQSWAVDVAADDESVDQCNDKWDSAQSSFWKRPKLTSQQFDSIRLQQAFRAAFTVVSSALQGAHKQSEDTSY